MRAAESCATIARQVREFEHPQNNRKEAKHLRGTHDCKLLEMRAVVLGLDLLDPAGVPIGNNAPPKLDPGFLNAVQEVRYDNSGAGWRSHEHGRCNLLNAVNLILPSWRAQACL